MDLSVIIPDTDSLLIGEIVGALDNQTLPVSRYETLVVGSDAPGLLIGLDSVRYIPTAAGVSASDKRNLGMEHALGKIFLFIDDDCLPAPDLLEQHLLRHQAGELVVGGAVTFDHRNYFQLSDNVSAFHDLLPFTSAGYRPYLAAANLSVDRSVVEAAGKMRPGRSRAEDLEWTVRFRTLGYQLYFEPAARIAHKPRRCTFTAVWRHWTGDAPLTLEVRLAYTQQLGTPRLAGYRPIFFWGAPWIAAWATMRTFSHPLTLLHYWHTLPLVYLTKLAWCWGAYKAGQ